MSLKKRWAVVGGGVLGLAAATKLAKSGQDVTLFESANQLGGLTSAWQLGDITWDRYYHVILLSDSRVRNVLSDLNLDQEIEWVQTRTGFFADGKLHSLSSTLDFLKFPVLSPMQKLRLGGTIALGSRLKDRRGLEKISVETWLRRWSGNATFEKIWLPLLKAKLGESYQQVSAAFIWSYINRMYKARRSGMKREMFGYVPGGYARILDCWSRRLMDHHVKTQFSSRIECIQRDSSQGTLQVRALSPLGNFEHTFDRVIMTTPCQVTEMACSNLSPAERQKLTSVQYLGVVCTSLLIDKPLGGYYVTNILDRWVPLTGIIEMGALVHPEKMGGHYLVYLPRYLVAGDPGFDESDEVIHARCLETLEKMYPSFRRSSVAAMQTARAKYVMALPTLNYSESLPPVCTSVPGLYILNSAQIVEGTLNVNETLELFEVEWSRCIWPNHLQMA